MFKQKVGYSCQDIDLIEFKIINFKNSKPLSSYIKNNIESKKGSIFLNVDLFNLEKKEYDLILEIKRIDSEVNDTISESRKNIRKLNSLESKRFFRALIHNYKDKFNRAFHIYISELSIFINYAEKIKSKIEDNKLYIQKLLDTQNALKVSEKNYLSSAFAISDTDRQKFILKSKYMQDSLTYKNIDDVFRKNQELEKKFAQKLKTDEIDIDRKIKSLDLFQQSLFKIKDDYSDKLGLKLTNQINDLNYHIEDLKVSIVDRESVDLRIIDFKNKFYDFEICFLNLVKRTKSLAASNAKTIEVLNLYGVIFPSEKESLDKSVDRLNSLMINSLADYDRNLEKSVKIGLEAI